MTRLNHGLRQFRRAFSAWLHHVATILAAVSQESLAAATDAAHVWPRLATGQYVSERSVSEAVNVTLLALILAIGLAAIVVAMFWPEILEAGL